MWGLKKLEKRISWERKCQLMWEKNPLLIHKGINISPDILVHSGN